MDALKGKTTIVTGGGSGIGREIALRFASAGVRLVICGRRGDVLAQVVEAVGEMAGQVIPVQADVSNGEDVERVVQTAVKHFGKVDILVNNAGIGGFGFIHEHDIDRWDRVIGVNLRGPFLFARAVLPLMRAQSHGEIINISSEAGMNYFEGNGAYGVSKHALIALGEYIRRENQEHGIRVNTICPGMVVTEMTENNPRLVHEKSLYPEDIADLVMWLVTRRSNVKIGKPILIQTMENPWVQ